MALESKESIDLSFAEFMLLLKEHNLSISDNSPLSVISKVEPEKDVKLLEQKGFLIKDGVLHDALVAICNPDFLSNSVIAFSTTAASSAYFTNRINSKLIVGCWPIGDKKLHISFPWEPTEIIANSLSTLVVNESVSSAEIKEIHFSVEGFTAFAAAVDSVRAVLLASTLQRQQISLFELPQKKLDEMLQTGTDNKAVDARWLVELFRTLAPANCFSSKKTISEKGFQELVEFGLIEINDTNHWSPSQKLMSIASDWLVPLPAIYHDATIIKSDGEQDVSSMMALRGSGPLCLIQFDCISDNNPMILLRSVEADEFWLHLMGQVTPPKAPEKAEPKEKTKPKIKIEPELISGNKVTACSSCGISLEPDLKFCTSCGAKAKVSNEPVTPTCSDCGAQIASNQKFCLNCGVKIKKAPELLSCNDCGAQVTSDLKFCTSCGKKL